MKDPLDHLIEIFERGPLWLDRELSVGAPIMDIIHECFPAKDVMGWFFEAHDGSLDAAMQFFSAVLPPGSGNGGTRWSVNIRIEGDASEQAHTAEVHDGNYCTTCCVSETARDQQHPSRALLLATLMAHRSWRVSNSET